jgi:putative ABC transport system substrate-binding protein
MLPWTADFEIRIISRDRLCQLIASFARPRGNATGINYFAHEVNAKRLELLHWLVPKGVRVAVLVNPADAAATETTLRDVPETPLAIADKVIE